MALARVNGRPRIQLVVALAACFSPTKLLPGALPDIRTVPEILGPATAHNDGLYACPEPGPGGNPQLRRPNVRSMTPAARTFMADRIRGPRLVAYPGGRIPSSLLLLTDQVIE